jgi:hypothetical protein
MNYFYALMRNSGLQEKLIVKRYLSKEGKKWGYYVF